MNISLAFGAILVAIGASAVLMTPIWRRLKDDSAALGYLVLGGVFITGGSALLLWG